MLGIECKPDCTAEVHPQPAQLITNLYAPRFGHSLTFKARAITRWGREGGLAQPCFARQSWEPDFPARVPLLVALGWAISVNLDLRPCPGLCSLLSVSLYHGHTNPQSSLRAPGLSCLRTVGASKIQDQRCHRSQKSLGWHRGRVPHLTLKTSPPPCNLRHRDWPQLCRTGGRGLAMQFYRHSYPEAKLTLITTLHHRHASWLLLTPHRGRRPSS